MSSIGSLVCRAFRWYREALVQTPRGQAIAREKVVAFVGCQEDHRVLDEVLEPGNYKVSFVTSIESAYSEIANALPDRVVLCMRADDERSLRVLSMLNLDPRTHHIRVTTCVASVVGDRDEGADLEGVNGLAPTRPGIVMH
jgi:CheY-like chemotaxis protein